MTERFFEFGKVEVTGRKPLDVLMVVVPVVAVTVVKLVSNAVIVTATRVMVVGWVSVFVAVVAS